MCVDMGLVRDTAMDRQVLGQGRILEALTDEDTVLAGTLDRLGRRFGLTADELRACMREMVRAGWVAVQTQPFGRLTVRLERRSHEPRPVTVERRRGMPDAWRLWPGGLVAGRASRRVQAGSPQQVALNERGSTMTPALPSRPVAAR